MKYSLTGHILDTTGREYLEFWSSDDQLGVRMPKTELKKIINYSQKGFPKETGGIIVGGYTPALDCAVVDSVTGAPKDSTVGATWFRRGKKGLRAMLERAWKKNKHYLGEWHSHPNGAPYPSPKDRSQMNQIVISKDYHTRRPILLILGGHPNNGWSAGVFVFGNGKQFIELMMVDQA